MPLAVDTAQLLSCIRDILEDYPVEFRTRVLRRVAEKNDLDAVAREFGLSTDLIFRWLKDNAESGPLLGARLPPPAGPSSPFAPTKTRGSEPAADGGLAEMISIGASLFGPLLLLFAFGVVRPSTQAQRVCVPLCILFGCVLFAWFVSRSNRNLEKRDLDLPPGNRVGIALVYLVLSGVSTFMLVLALPAIPHRFTSTPVEVRTTVVRRYVEHGKNTYYCLATPAFDSRIAPLEWCTDRTTFDRARVGETIILHGSTSWFGFMQGDFVLVPYDPK